LRKVSGEKLSSVPLADLCSIGGFVMKKQKPIDKKTNSAPAKNLIEMAIKPKISIGFAISCRLASAESEIYVSRKGLRSGHHRESSEGF
jgi:hypothetical protein